MTLWRDVKGYEGLYLVSDEGGVYSLPRRVSNGRGEYVRTGQMLKAGLRGRNGFRYEFVILSDGKTVSHKAVHRLVAEAFVDKPNGMDVINHIDKNTLNNRADNLEWCTQQYNNEYGHNKRVQQLDKRGNLVNEYKSLTFASESTGILRTAISNALTNRVKTAGGYIWKFATY